MECSARSARLGLHRPLIAASRSVGGAAGRVCCPWGDQNTRVPEGTTSMRTHCPASHDLFIWLVKKNAPRRVSLILYFPRSLGLRLKRAGNLGLWQRLLQVPGHGSSHTPDASSSSSHLNNTLVPHSKTRSPS